MNVSFPIHVTVITVQGIGQCEGGTSLLIHSPNNPKMMLQNADYIWLHKYRSQILFYDLPAQVVNIEFFNFKFAFMRKGKEKPLILTQFSMPFESMGAFY